MFKRFVLLCSILLCLGLVLTACGTSEKTSKEEKPKATANNKKEDEKDESKEEAEESKEQNDSDQPDFKKLIKFMEKETEGKAKVLYENGDAQEHKLDDVSVKLDGYTLVELKDFHRDFSIPFGDQTDGAVILAQFTIKNDSDKDVYYMPSLDVFYPGSPKVHTNYDQLTPEDGQLPNKLAPSNDYELKAGETVSGYVAYPFGQDVLEKILDLKTITIDVPEAQGKKGEFSNPIGQKGKFTLSLNADGEKKASDAAAFYEDKASFENMGEKKMLKEKDGIGKTEKLGDVDVTFEGYQFTKFTPNEVEAPRFKNFDTGIVLLTAKFSIKNNGSDEVSLSSLSSKLTMNDGSSYTLNEGMLEPSIPYDHVLTKGNPEEAFKVFTIDEEQYEKILKDKAFEIEIGPMRDKDAKDVSKGKKVTFELPK